MGGFAGDVTENGHGHGTMFREGGHHLLCVCGAMGLDPCGIYSWLGCYQDTVVRVLGKMHLRIRNMCGELRKVYVRVCARYKIQNRKSGINIVLQKE